MLHSRVYLQYWILTFLRYLYLLLMPFYRSLANYFHLSQFQELMIELH